MANPLDDVTQDRRDDAGNPLRRVYVFGDPDQPVGDPGGSNNALSAVSQPAAQPQQQWTMEDLQKGIAALKDYLGGNVEGVNSLAKRFTNYDRQFTSDVLNAPSTIWNNLGKSNEVGQRLLGGENWLSNMVRSATTAPGKAAASETPITSEEMIAPAQDIAGMATGSMLFGKPGAGTLGSGPLRPGAKAVPTETAPVFYSALEHAATNAAQDVMSPQQWLGFLKNQPGVKAEELAWTGLPEWLGAQKGKVKKEDVKAYLDEHKVEIKDVTKKGESRHEDDANDGALEHAEFVFNQQPQNVRDAYGHDIDRWLETQDGQRAYDEGLNLAGAGEGNTKYSSYQLPGGENYREHLLTMPQKEYTVKDVKTRQGPAGDTQYFVEDRTNPSNRTNRYDSPEEAAKAANYNAGWGSAGSQYKSSHWDEPNVLAHVRTNDRVVDGKKALHIEEIQSDWHQQGRKQGYKEEVSKEQREAVAKRDADMRNEFDDAVLQAYERHHGNTTNVTPRHVNGWRDKILQAEGKIDELPSWANTPEVQKAAQDYSGAFNEALALDKKRHGVPDAPFKTSWPELALKRMIRKASEEGYDRISWTPGEAQAARYDLSKTISRIEHNEYPSGQKGITAYDLKGNKVIDKYIKDEELADTIGKDAAEKLLAQEPKDIKEQGRVASKERALEGIDLKVGGEGMREFYDKMLPKMVEKIGKAHGVKVKRTPGQETRFGIMQGDRAVSPPEGFKTAAEARQWALDNGWQGKSATVREVQSEMPALHYFDLPESLRHHAVGKGFPLYMSSIPFPLVPVDYNPFKQEK